jgi:predicted dienelactone hydrolase
MIRRLRTFEALFLLFTLPALFLAACGEGDEPPFSAPSVSQLPTQPGPFGVGVRQITFTKKSATMPTQDRVLLTDIWYPTTPNAGPLDVDLGGVVNAPWAAGAVNLPLLLFSHGGCAFPTLYRFFMRALASYGFIVAAPLHVGDLMTDPNCGINDSDGYANRPFDIRFVIDSLLQLNTDPTSFFSGAINSHRIGMSGNSNGGNTTVLVSESDPRVIAGLVLTGSSAGLVAKIHIPMMVQVGALDSVCPFDRCERPLYLALNPPKYLVEILHTGHTAFTDDGCYQNCCGPSSDCNACYPARPIPFCDAAGPDALTADAAHQFILRYAVPFLLHWVAGDNRFDAFLAPGAAPPGVIFTADTGGSSTSTPTPAP